MRRAKTNLDHFKTALNIALGVSNGFAVFTCKQFGKAVIFGFNQFKELAQNTNAALRVGCTPCRLCGLGIFHRFADFVFCGESDSTLHRAIKRLENIRCTSAFASDMLAADEMSYSAH